jgi:hypothetical protein
MPLRVRRPSVTSVVAVARRFAVAGAGLNTASPFEVGLGRTVAELSE